MPACMHECQLIKIQTSQEVNDRLYSDSEKGPAILEKQEKMVSASELVECQ